MEMKAKNSTRIQHTAQCAPSQYRFSAAQAAIED